MQAVEMAQIKVVLMQGMESLIAVAVVVVDAMATPQERADLESLLSISKLNTNKKGIWDLIFRKSTIKF